MPNELEIIYGISLFIDWVIDLCLTSFSKLFHLNRGIHGSAPIYAFSEFFFYQYSF